MNNELRDVAFVQFPEVRELDEQPAQVLKTSAKNAFVFSPIQVRKHHSEVVKSRPALPSREMKSKPGEGFCGMVRETARHDFERFDEEQSQCVLGESFNASAHPCYFCIFWKPTNA